MMQLQPLLIKQKPACVVHTNRMVRHRDVALPGVGRRTPAGPTSACHYWIPVLVGYRRQRTQDHDSEKNSNKLNSWLKSNV